jgi:hypothetical protein
MTTRTTYEQGQRAIYVDFKVPNYNYRLCREPHISVPQQYTSTLSCKQPAQHFRTILELNICYYMRAQLYSIVHASKHKAE